MWNKRRSLLLSQVCIFIFAVMGACLCVGMPWAANFLIENSGTNLHGKYALILISGYTISVPAFAVLFFLYKLLRNIRQSKVFIWENTAYLRRISWLCIAAGAICFISALYYPQAAIIGIMAAFLGLIIRVLKNVFAQAVQIKEENDFTI